MLPAPTSNLLTKAAACGEYDRVLSLIRLGADVNALVWPHQMTPLMASIEHGYYDVSELLMASGADAYLTTNDGMNALILAARIGDAGLMRILLRGKAIRPEQESFLHQAFEECYQANKPSPASALLDTNLQFDLTGSPDDAETQRRRRFVLFARALGGVDTDALEVIGEAIHTGLDVNDMTWGNLLIEACERGSIDCIRFLLEQGADVNARYTIPFLEDLPLTSTPLETAQERGDAAILQLLEEWRQ